MAGPLPMARTLELSADLRFVYNEAAAAPDLGHADLARWSAKVTALLTLHYPQFAFYKEETINCDLFERTIDGFLKARRWPRSLISPAEWLRCEAFHCRAHIQ